VLVRLSNAAYHCPWDSQIPTCESKLPLVSEIRSASPCQTSPSRGIVPKRPVRLPPPQQADYGRLGQCQR